MVKYFPVFYSYPLPMSYGHIYPGSQTQITLINFELFFTCHFNIFTQYELYYHSKNVSSIFLEIFSLCL